MRLLRFAYHNWRGEDHQYIVLPAGAGLESLQHAETRDTVPVLHGIILTRDGDTRRDELREHPGGRRRTFRMVEMRDIEEIDAAELSDDAASLLRDAGMSG